MRQQAWYAQLSGRRAGPKNDHNLQNPLTQPKVENQQKITINRRKS